MKILSGKEYRRLSEKAADAARLHNEAMDLMAKLNKATLETTKLRADMKSMTEELERMKNALDACDVSEEKSAPKTERKKKLTQKAAKKQNL